MLRGTDEVWVELYRLPMYASEQKGNTTRFFTCLLPPKTPAEPQVPAKRQVRCGAVVDIQGRMVQRKKGSYTRLVCQLSVVPHER